MATIEEVQESLKSLWDRVFSGPDNQHKRIGLLEYFRDNFIVYELPRVQDDVKYLQKDLEEFKEKILGDGDGGLLDRKIKESEERLNGTIKQSIGEAFADREKLQREKWDTRTWAIVLIGLGLLGERLWTIIFGP